MDRVTRSKFQGVWTIVRFNWHFYIIAVVMGFAGVALAFQFPPLWIVVAGGVFVTLLSLAVSHWIYDRSKLYDFPWIDGTESSLVVNIHSGFDETSALLAEMLQKAELRVYDFYDPQKHTEISIKRARSCCPPFPGTVSISTNSIPLETGEADLVVLHMAAHEIRELEERNIFFGEVARCLRNDGKVIVTEHLRDLPNFLAFTFGFLHFHSRNSWLSSFERSGLLIESETKVTPFVSTFVLRRDPLTA